MGFGEACQCHHEHPRNSCTLEEAAAELELVERLGRERREREEAAARPPEAHLPSERSEGQNRARIPQET